ncbi:MAG: sugar phosphate isomerase/epimerase family protein [Candidatus Baldrarchaeia archaeon]|mgnify:CR=1 FL=1
MRIGVLTSPRPTKFYLNLAEHHGIDHVEIDIYTNYALAENPESSEVREIAEIADSLGISLSIHTPYTLNFGDRIPMIRNAHIRLYDRILRLADVLNAKWVTTHIGHHIGYREGKRKALEIAIDTFRRFIPVLENIQIPAAIENLKPVPDCSELVYLCDNIPEIQYLLRSLDSDMIKLCLDVGHANLAEGALRYIDEFSNKIVCVHAHDNDGTEDLHKPPGTGNIDWKALIGKLKDIKFTGAIVIEVYEPNLSLEGIKYLRSLLLEW